MKTGDLKTQHDEINVLQPSGNFCGKIERTRETGASYSFGLGEGRLGRIEGKSADTKYCRPFSHTLSDGPIFSENLIIYMNFWLLFYT